MSRKRPESRNQAQTEIAGSGTPVIGWQLADASEAEKRRLASGPITRSPMPKRQYDFWRGDLDLIKPGPLPLDAEIASACENFAASDAATRAAMRNSISMDEFYSLLHFAKRASIFAIRENKAEWLSAGLTAIAMIEIDRIDYRDISLPLPLLHFAAVRVGLDAAKYFADAAGLAAASVAVSINSAFRTFRANKPLRAYSVYDPVETPVGIGFIQFGPFRSKRYKPTCDMKAVAIALADCLAVDKYQPSSVAIGTDLPPTWLHSVDNDSLDRAMNGIRAGASLHAELRPPETPVSPCYHGSHMVMVFVAETRNSGDSQTLLLACPTKTNDDRCCLGVSEGNLFCLLVAQPHTIGVPPFETPTSMERFLRPIAAILRQYGAKKWLTASP